ncbi:hypothetical protein V3H46_21480 [Vibrio parahaemolyticus]|uniref:hypothetical protein n=1 Tax=Vibrio parahaemolyticus TaxID=670 RepID=UPI003B66F477
MTTILPEGVVTNWAVFECELKKFYSIIAEQMGHSPELPKKKEGTINGQQLDISSDYIESATDAMWKLSHELTDSARKVQNS